jgi:hypothetical protein
MRERTLNSKQLARIVNIYIIVFAAIIWFLCNGRLTSDEHSDEQTDVGSAAVSLKIYSIYTAAQFATKQR